MANDSVPTYRDCLAGSRRVKTAELGSVVLRSVRPPGVAAVISSRAPLALILYVAGLEGRLVWQGIEGFALLEPPIARPEIWRNRVWGRAAVLGWLDRRWSTVIFGLPAVLAVVVAVLLLPFASLRLVAVLVLVAGMVYVVAVMLVMVVWQLFLGRDDGPEKLALDGMASDEWTMRLFHQEHEHRVDELFDQVRHRLRRLVAAKVRDDASERGGQVGPVRLSTRLVCVHDGVTSEAARLRLEAVRGVNHPGFTLRFFDSRPDDVARRPARPPAFFRFYAGSVLVVVFCLALLVLSVEREECVGDCSGAPTTYGRALAWIAYQMVWREAPGITAVSGFSTVLGWMLSALLPMVLIVGVVAFRAQARFMDVAKRDLERKGVQVMGSTRVLIVTVTDKELEAVLDVFEGHTGKRVKPRFDGSVPVFALGAVNDTELFVVQAGAQGITNPAGALTVSAEAIRHLSPHYALIVGICYGLQPEAQKIGDVLVSERIRDLDHGKLLALGDEVREVLRGETVVPSAMLLNSVRAARRGWERPDGPKVRFGMMLAWNKLLDSVPAVESLRKNHCDAIGGDMEGAGFQAAARFAGVECLLIKSICDWGHHKTREHQREAALNAAEFVLHVVRVGALAHTPAERRGTA